MAETRDKGIGEAVKAVWSTLERVRLSANWERKLLGASYVHHRDGYEGTKVEARQTHDSSAIDYLNTFLSGFVGYMMPEDDTWADLVPMRRDETTRRWQYASIADLDQEEGVLREAEKCVQAVMQCYANTNYYSEIRMAAKDYLVFGTGYIMACEAEDGIYYRCFDPQEVCIAEDYARRVNVFVRKFTMDARDIVREYSDKSWPALEMAIRRNGGEYSAVDCYEAVMPRGYLYVDGRTVDFVGGRDYVHFMYVDTEGALAFEHGMERFPVACVRRNRDNTKTPYGIGLVEECLAVIIELDDMGRIRQIMRQKNADPPMNVPYSLQGHFSSRPGARNYVSDMSNVPTPTVDQYNASELLADIQDMRAQLRSLMGADLFRTVMGSTDSRKTAYEVSERKNEAMTLLQMQIGTFKIECVEPIFKRTLRILHDHRVITFRDQTIRQRDGRDRVIGARQVTFESFLAASKVELNSVFVRRVEAYLQYQQDIQTLQILTSVSQIFPAALLNVDENAFTRGLLYGAGSPRRYIKELSETKKEQEGYREMQQQAMQTQQLTELSGAAKNMAGANAASAQGGQAV